MFFELNTKQNILRSFEEIRNFGKNSTLEGKITDYLPICLQKAG